MSDTIQCLEHDGWFEITLNRPDQLNSFTDEMHLALRACLQKAKDNSARAVLLTGAGRGFCAGQDLGDRDPSKTDRPPDLGATVRSFYAPLVKQIRELPCPVVCAVNGVAAGAGANIALACDIVLAAKSAKFIQSFSKVGLIPDTGGSWHLPHLLGEVRAKGLAFTAEPLSAEKAESWGLIWKSVENASLMKTARDMVESFAKGPTLGLALTKEAIQTSWDNDLLTHLDKEAEFMTRCGESADYAEGVSSFLEKRAPNFKGR